VHVVGREQAEAGVRVLLGVPAEEVAAEAPGVLDTAEALREVRPGLQRLDVRLPNPIRTLDNSLTPSQAVAKVGTDTSHMGDAIRRFGFLHDGSIDTINRFHLGPGFIQSPTNPDAPPVGPSGDALREMMDEVTYTCVPPGLGLRIGIDRDGDGAGDGDEEVAGTNPANPASQPGSTR